MFRSVLLVLALASCVPSEPDGQILDAHTDTDAVVALHRAASGPFVPGETERFSLELAQHAADRAVIWSSSGGEVVGDGTDVHWTLPAQRTATLTAELVGLDGSSDRISWNVGVRVPAAYLTTMQGPVDNSTDITGSGCALRYDTAGDAHLLYQNETHGQIWHATFNGVSWTAELVDGPGFDVGSTISRHLDMEIDSSDDVHVAYAHSNPPYAVWWASNAGGSWTREQVSDATHFNFTSIGLDLDPTLSERPTVGWTQDVTYDRTVVSARTAADTWTHSRFSETDYSQQFTGGMAFAADGTLHMTKGSISRNYLAWTASGGFSPDTYLIYGPNYLYWSQLVLDASDRPIVFHEAGIEHDTGSGWFHSEVENFELTDFDITWGNDQPYIALRHGSNLELVTTDTNGYFQYAVIDTMDGYNPSIALDGDGDPHICYRKDGQVHFY